MTKLIKLLESWLDRYPIKKQADLLGLKYAGYGRWADKTTGKIIAKSVNGKIVSIQGTTGNEPISPADGPNQMTAEPIAGNSVEGNTTNMISSHDAQNQLPAVKTPSYVMKPF